MWEEQIEKINFISLRREFFFKDIDMDIDTVKQTRSQTDTQTDRQTAIIVDGKHLVEKNRKMM